MKYIANIGKNDFISNIHSVNVELLSFVQDTPHIGTKSRNRLFKPGIILPIGNKQISVSHLKILINKVPKDVHGLVYKDICPDDRQNFNSFEKMIQERVFNALSAHVSDSQGTIMYLKLCKKVIRSYNDFTLTPEQRIYEIWYPTYFLRGWRKWISGKAQQNRKNTKKNSEGIDVNVRYTLKDNFISSNAYSCIEINAYSMVQLIIKLREKTVQSYLCRIYSIVNLVNPCFVRCVQ